MHTDCCCCCCCCSFVCCYAVVLGGDGGRDIAAAVLLLPAAVRHRVPDGLVGALNLMPLFSFSSSSRDFVCAPWRYYVVSHLGSRFAFVHPRKLLTCAETMRVSASRSEAPLVHLVHLANHFFPPNCFVLRTAYTTIVVLLLLLCHTLCTR